MENPISNKYKELQQTETELFKAYPLLKVGKTVTQTLAVPALTAGALSHMPLAGPAIGSAVQHGTDFMQNHLHNYNASRITQQFNDLRQNIQPGFAYGIRQKAFDTWANVRSADLLAKSDLWTKPLSGYLAPTAVGKAILDTAPVAYNYVTELPVSKQIAGVVAQSQAVLNNVKDWLTSSYNNIVEYKDHAQRFLQQEVNKLSNNQQHSDQQRPSEQNTHIEGPELPIMPPPPLVNDQDFRVVEGQEAAMDDGYSMEDYQPEDEFIDLGPTETDQDLIPTEIQPPIAEAPLVDDPLGESVGDPDADSPELLDLEGTGNDDALDYFQALASEFAGRGMSTDKMKIFFDNKEVFRFHDGHPDLDHSPITNDQMAQFKEALADPINFKGNLEIRKGNDLLLSIRDGKVFDPMNKVQELLKIKLDAAPAEKEAPVQAPDSPIEGMYARHSEGVTAKGMDGAKEIAVNAIKAGNMTQAEIKAMLLENNPTLKATANAEGVESADKDAQNLIKAASKEVLKAQPEYKQQQQQKQQLAQKQQQQQKPSHSL